MHKITVIIQYFLNKYCHVSNIAKNIENNIIKYINFNLIINCQQKHIEQYVIKKCIITHIREYIKIM